MSLWILRCLTLVYIWKFPSFILKKLHPWIARQAFQHFLWTLLEVLRGHLPSKDRTWGSVTMIFMGCHFRYSSLKASLNTPLCHFVDSSLFSFRQRNLQINLQINKQMHIWYESSSLYIVKTNFAVTLPKTISHRFNLDTVIMNHAMTKNLGCCHDPKT